MKDTIKLQALIDHLRAAQTKYGNLPVQVYDNWGRPIRDPVLSQRDGPNLTPHLQFQTKES